MLNLSLNNARILIVDDQASNIALLENVLEREGYTDLKSTTDSRQVVILFDQFQPDLILLDLRMPHLDGFAVMEQLRGRIRSEGYLPILVLTADVTPETKRRALTMGARDFLTKPVDVVEVSLRIRNLLETRYLHLQLKNQNQGLERKIQERTAELRQRIEDLALINALNAAINQRDDLQKIIALMSVELHRIFHCIGTMTAIPNPDNKFLIIQHIEFPAPLARQIEKLIGASIWSIPLKIPLTGTGQFAQALRAGTPQAINDPDTITAMIAEYTENQLLKGQAAPVCRALGISSMIVIPLISENEFFGLLAMARVEPTNPTELSRVQSIAGQLTSAIGRRRAEEALHESEARFREVLENSLDASYKRNLQTNSYEYLSPVFEKIFSYTSNEFVNLPLATVLELIHPDDREKGNHVIAEALSGPHGSIWQWDYRFKHKDGQYRWLHDQFIMMRDAQGQPAAWIGSVSDITESKQRENELQAIASLSAGLRSAETRAEMLAVTVKQLSSLLRCDAISAEMIDFSTGDSVVEAAYGIWAALSGYHQPAGAGLNTIIRKTRKPYHNNRMASEPRIAIPGFLLDGILAGVGVPLIAQDQLIGFLWVGRRNEIAESEVRLLAAVADIAANAIYRATLHEQAQKDASDLIHAYDTTLEGWAHALELRDQETEGHTRRVIQMTVELACKMGFGSTALENIRRGALLHDIGKMGIPDSVLLKPGTLNEREWEIMRRHPEYANHFLEPIEYLHPVMDIPYCHHEKWDGSGYPRGLKGVEIPFVARIFAIVDVWDALRSDRPYRKAWSSDKTRAYIVEQSGVHFDPQVVQAFLELLRKWSEFDRMISPSPN